MRASPKTRPNRSACAKRSLYRPTLECLESRWLPSGGLGGFAQVNLASDVPALARTLDPNLINPWGLSYSPTGPFWLANNQAGNSDLLDGRGRIIPLVVNVPGSDPANGTPTGTVFNGGSGFVISADGVSHPGRFLFATQDGLITAWNSFVDPNQALVVVNHSSAGAVYDGLALATDPAGRSFLYAADFSLGTIDVFDERFQPVVSPDAFHDASIPSDFAPFNVQNIGNRLYVTYAQKDSASNGDLPGQGHGFVDVYDAQGVLLQRLAAGGELNSPWGLALAPANFGPFGGALLVGNNGDGHILAFDANTGAFLGSLLDGQGEPLAIPDLWALSFGNDHAGGASDTLFFAAGVDNDLHGLFGAIQSPQTRGADTGGAGVFDPHAPGEPNDYPLPPVEGPALQSNSTPASSPATVLLPLAESSLALAPTLVSALPSNASNVATIPAVPVVNVSFDRSVTATLLATGATYFGSPIDDLPQSASLPANDHSLNALLDLASVQVDSTPNAIEPWTASPPGTNISRSAATISPASSNAAQAEISVASESSSASTQDAGEETETGKASYLTKGLGISRTCLLAFSIPIAWGFMQITRIKPRTLPSAPTLKETEKTLLLPNR